MLISDFAQIGDQGNNLSTTVDITDDMSATQFHWSISGKSVLSLSYVQALTPSLVLGGISTHSIEDRSNHDNGVSTRFSLGIGKYSLGKGTVDRALGGVYTTEDTTVAAQWDKKDVSVIQVCSIAYLCNGIFFF